MNMTIYNYVSSFNISVLDWKYEKEKKAKYANLRHLLCSEMQSPKKVFILLIFLMANNFYFTKMYWLNFNIIAIEVYLIHMYSY